MEPQLLEEIGLSPGESKVYLALSKLGASKTGILAKEAGVSSSKVYKILDRLIKKGLVGHVLKGKIKYFTATEPKRILDYLEEKEKELEKKKTNIKHLIPQLEIAQKLAGKKSEAVIYEGLKAIKNFYLNILTELKKGETYYVLGATYGENQPGLKEFYQNYHTQRTKKDIHVKMLANHDIKNHLVPATLSKAEIRYLPQYLITNMIIIFYKNKAFLFFLTEEPLGFLMQNQEAVNGFKNYFQAFWKTAKK